MTTLPNYTPKADIDLISLASPVLIMGPSYSGKSLFSHNLLNQEVKTAVIGTANLSEPELFDRVEALKKLRPKEWDHFEDRLDLAELMKELVPSYPQILLDSVNQWIAARLVRGSGKYSFEQLESLIYQDIKRSPLFSLCIRILV